MASQKMMKENNNGSEIFLDKIRNQAKIPVYAPFISKMMIISLLAKTKISVEKDAEKVMNFS